MGAAAPPVSDGSPRAGLPGPGPVKQAVLVQNDPEQPQAVFSAERPVSRLIPGRSPRLLPHPGLKIKCSCKVIKNSREAIFLAIRFGCRDSGEKRGHQDKLFYCEAIKNSREAIFWAVRFGCRDSGEKRGHQDKFFYCEAIKNSREAIFSAIRFGCRDSGEKRGHQDKFFYCEAIKNSRRLFFGHPFRLPRSGEKRGHQDKFFIAKQ